jgi:polyisoprenoid-binding protein YceI
VIARSQVPAWRVAALILLLAAGAASAAPREYRIDPVHTRVLVSVDHLGFSQALGTLSAPRGRLLFDPRDWTTARVEVEIDLARIDFGDPDWNERMLRRDFLDAALHPVARFVSTHVQPLDENNARVHGTLSLRGITLPLVLEARLNRHARHQLTLRSTAGFSATATLSRAALGMTTWKNVVGDTIQVRIEVEAQRARRSREGDDAVAQ